MEEIVIELADRAGTLPGIRQATSAGAEWEILRRINGLEPMKKYTAEELVDIRLKNFTGDPTKGLDYFKENGDILHPETAHDAMLRICHFCGEG